MLKTSMPMVWYSHKKSLEHRDGPSPGPDTRREGFSAVQFVSAAIHLLEAKHNAVSISDMQLLLGRLSLRRSISGGSEDDAMVAGKIVLQSMVLANALSLRPYSDWAQDIPLETYQGDHSAGVAPQATVSQSSSLATVQTVSQPPDYYWNSVIVTAPSALDLHCMRQLRQKLDKILQHFRQQQVGMGYIVIIVFPNPKSRRVGKTVQTGLTGRMLHSATLSPPWV